MKKLTCDICGANEAKIRRVTRVFGRGEGMIVVENVPAIHCASCGETYFTAETLEALDATRKDVSANAKLRPIAVATFT